MTKKQRIPMREAMNLVPDDLPDGAFWAMAHEFAGLEYGEGFDEIAEEDEQDHFGPAAVKDHVCQKCNKRFATSRARYQHFQAKHITRKSSSKEPQR